MAAGKRRRSDRSGRAKLNSPGRPSVARVTERRRFWRAIAAGISSEDAAVEAGVSPAVGSRWFREAGGMPPTHLNPSSTPPSGRYLSFAEREDLAIFHAQGHGVREIARRLDRAPSTISRELRRNAATRAGRLEYRATTAQWHADCSAQRPKAAKLAVNPALRSYVEDRLAAVGVADDEHVLGIERFPVTGRQELDEVPLPWVSILELVTEDVVVLVSDLRLDRWVLHEFERGSNQVSKVDQRSRAQALFVRFIPSD